jgi:hypothetical protein
MDPSTFQVRISGLSPQEQLEAINEVKVMQASRPWAQLQLQMNCHTSTVLWHALQHPQPDQHTAAAGLYVQYGYTGEGARQRVQMVLT